MCSAHVYSNIRNSNNNKICLHKDTSCPNFSPNSRLAPPYFLETNCGLPIANVIKSHITRIKVVKHIR